MEKKLLNEYDDTKRLLQRLRGINKQSLNEQSQEQRNSVDTSNFSNQNTVQDPSSKSVEQVKDNILAINDVDVKLLASDALGVKMDDTQKQAISSLIDNFKQQVTQLANLTPGIVITADQIRLDGVLQDYDLKFTYIAGREMGTYINANMLKIDSSVTDILSKLYKFETTFKQTFEPIINNRQNN
jgi:hypothetical protein